MLIDLLRHGECQGGEIFRGSTDVCLTERGWQQMRQSAALLQDEVGAFPWGAIVSSPLLRCRRFAEEQAGRSGLPVEIDEDLRELSFGEWEGRLRDELWRENREAIEAFYRDPVHSAAPGGESAQAMQERAVGALQRVQEKDAKHVLVVAHGGVIRALLAYALGLPLQQIFTLDVPYACLTRLKRRGDHLQLLGHAPQSFIGE